METNCDPFLVDFFLYSYVFKPKLLGTKKKNNSILEFTFCYIDYVLLQNNSKFGNYVERINSIEFEISASYFDLLLEIENEDRLLNQIYNKYDDFIIF